MDAYRKSLEIVKGQDIPASNSFFPVDAVTAQDILNKYRESAK
jgi:hypothetical protein